MTELGIADDRALGVSVRVVVTRSARLASAKAAADRCLREMDAAASRFRADSELSRINASPEREMVLSPLLGRAISEALRGARVTQGAVDPTVGMAVRLSGYGTDFSSMPADGPAPALVAVRIPGWRAIRYHEHSRMLWLPRGVELDLGSTAKALAADLAAAAALEAAGGGGVLVSLGGDIAVAGEAPAGGWKIQVSEDSGAVIDRGEETIAIIDGAIATSSTTVRRWVRGGIELHHIVDPATGLPASGRWRTATVVAGSCVDANIASTAAIVMSDAATAWLDEHKLPARLVGRDGTVFRSARWPVP
ncbi:MAG TPA: FAD:protein FMN transferase [Candidatus Dormibacteraeota bacterium]|nr:FAD:protein FMN transferase [Candidatus Dormibacteraeota bacterium]